MAYSPDPTAVTIAEPEGIPPIYSELGEPISNSLIQNPKQHRASGARRLTGRLNRPSLEQLPKILSYGLTRSPGPLPVGESAVTHLHSSSNDPHADLLSQVTAWVHEEKAKRLRQPPSENLQDRDLSLQKLENILAEHASLAKHISRSFEGEGSYFSKRKSSSKKLRKGSFAAHPSDTEYHDGEPIVPTTDVVLDNTKTVGFSDAKEKQGWLEFKNEIIRLTHTLRLKGWRRVPLDRGADIGVDRISGALTNAVYVVSPPKALPELPSVETSEAYMSKRRPVKLLLRIYGPQAGHLIDREKELEILKRLAQKKIGPRLLGTFINGRFEQYLNANPLTPDDLRDPETSKQIAKRMRELHDGIDLTIEERHAGPLLWRNWDKWVKRCEEVITWLDQQIMAQKQPSRSKIDVWKTRGFVCGVPWAPFRKAVDSYRKWLEEKYGGKQGIRDQLVFAHNDTQYGNILRIEPTGESPLLLPTNEHKQLVVIDFEYANASTPGLEFANHFTEWCYNYHWPTAPWACNVKAYPRPEEQRRFVRAYIQHRPGFNLQPSFTGHTRSGSDSSDGKASVVSSNVRADSGSSVSSSLAAFMLDARHPLNYSYAEEERAREEALNQQIERLMHEARLWRVANSAQWVAWGIVQAKVDGMEEALAKDRSKQERKEEPAVGTQSSPSSPQLHHDHEIEEEEEEEGGFDYLAYAQDRALFFWGDLLELGLVKEEDLPDNVVQKAKRIGY